MTKLRKISAILILSFSFCFTSSALLAEPVTKQYRILLITDAEAAQPDAKPIKGLFGGEEEPSNGPTIEFKAPTPGSEVVKPVPIRIDFKENQAPVDLSSLEVTYLKMISIDITDRIKPFATVSGINLKQADLPSGSHKVRFSIKDIKDNLSEKTLKVTIVDEE